MLRQRHTGQISNRTSFFSATNPINVQEDMKRREIENYLEEYADTLPKDTDLLEKLTLIRTMRLQLLLQRGLINEISANPTLYTAATLAALTTAAVALGFLIHRLTRDENPQPRPKPTHKYDLRPRKNR